MPFKRFEIMLTHFGKKKPHNFGKCVFLLVLFFWQTLGAQKKVLNLKEKNRVGFFEEVENTLNPCLFQREVKFNFSFVGLESTNLSPSTLFFSLSTDKIPNLKTGKRLLSGTRGTRGDAGRKPSENPENRDNNFQS